MEIKPNPFSVYDFLGYFTPGALAIYGGIIIESHVNGQLTFQYLLDKLSFERAEMYVPFVLSAYLLGHFFSYLSSVTIERYAIWAYDYPSRFLLGLNVKSYWGIEATSEKIARFVLGAAIFPIPFLECTVGRLLNLRSLFTRPLPNDLASLLKAKVTCLIVQKGQVLDPGSYTIDQDNDFFRYVYHYAVEYASNHFPKMQNYVALYGFLRAIAFMFVIASWVSLIHLLIRIWEAICGDEVQIMDHLCLLLILMIATYISHLGFMKFYRRFSLEALMAVGVVFECASKSHIERGI